MAYKGLDLLLAAWRDIQQRQPQAELMIAGAGDLTPYAQQFASLTGIICTNRWIDDAEIPRFFAAADAVVLPYREASQSGVTCQAYAAGLPIVATPVGGLVEQVIDGQTGILATDGSAGALAAALHRLMEPTTYPALSAGAAQRGQALAFTAQAPSYAALCRRVMAQRNAGTA